MGDVRRDRDDLAGRLVSQDVVARDDHGPDAAFMPEMNVGSVRRRHIISNSKDLDSLDPEGTTYPQIPVLRTSTVTSPGFNPCLLLTCSREGVVSATHRSWLVLVNTPMLGLSITVALAMASQRNTRADREISKRREMCREAKGGERREDEEGLRREVPSFYSYNAELPLQNALKRTGRMSKDFPLLLQRNQP